MDNLILKIKTIQNKQKTLRWGSAENDSGEVIIAVGSVAYPKQTQYFIVDADRCVYLINDKHKKEMFRRCETDQNVVACAIELLKTWFPAKGN